MALSLNISEHGNTLHRVPLGANNYNFRLYWNTRASAWEMDVEFSNGTVICNGITLVPNVSLMDAFLYTGFTGVLQVRNLKGDGEEKLTFSNLGYGKSFELIWFSQEEIDASIAAT